MGDSSILTRMPKKVRNVLGGSNYQWYYLDAVENALRGDDGSRKGVENMM